MTNGGGDAVRVSMIESDSGSALIEYALIVALVSIVLVAVSGELYFPQAPVVALSEVAAQPRAAGSTGTGTATGAATPPRSWDGAASIARVNGTGYPRGPGMDAEVSIASALGSELGQGKPPVPIVDGSPPSHRPGPPQAARSEAAASPQATSPQTGDPIAPARPPEPAEDTAEGTAEETKDRTARDSGSRPAGDGNTAAGLGPRRPGPAAERLTALEPDAVAEVPVTVATGLGGLPKDAGDRTIRETDPLSAFRWNDGSARSAGPRGAIARDAVDPNQSWLWALVLLVLAGLGLGLGPRRLRRRLILLLRFAAPVKGSAGPGDSR